MKSKKILISAIIFLVVVGLGLFIVLNIWESTPKLAELEKTRQEKIEKELSRTFVKRISTNVIEGLKKYPGVTPEELVHYKKGLKDLIEVGPVMFDLYRDQTGTPPEVELLAKTEDDKELIKRYGQPWCLADTSRECVAIPSMPERKNVLVPEDVSCKEAAKMGSPFEIAYREEDGKIYLYPYAKSYGEELSEAVLLLNKAAKEFEQIPRERLFAIHLRDVAEAFQSEEPFPFYKSDKSWVDFLASDSLFFIRVGPDEVGGVGDNCDVKAMYHFNLGLRDKEAEKSVATLASRIQEIENNFADLIDMPEHYQAREVNVHTPLFVNVLIATGDDIDSPHGYTVAQTLPNWCGKDGKGECPHGTMVYVNKMREGYGQDILDKYFKPMIDKKFHKYVAPGAGVKIFVFHEVFHNLGPRYPIKKLNSDKTYADNLISKKGESWVGATEEFKAETGAIYVLTQFYNEAKEAYEEGEISKKEFLRAKEAYEGEMTAHLMWCLGMIMRGYMFGDEFKTRNPYARLATIHLGYLTEEEAFEYDDGVWSIDIEKMPEAAVKLTKKMGQVYAKTDVGEVEELFTFYMSGDGNKLLHKDRIKEVLGNRPSVMFEYEVKGLD